MRKSMYILSLVLIVFVILSGCETAPPKTIEDACGIPLERFKDAPVSDPLVTSDLTRTSQRLTGYFGTVLSLTIYTTDDVDPDDVFTCVEMIYQTVHQHATSYEMFEGITNIARINEDPSQTYTIDPLLTDILQTGIDYSTEVNEHFDITLGPVLEYWDDAMITCNEGGPCEVPEQTDLNNANQYVGLDKIQLDGNSLTLEDGMNLELGGIAKGYAAGLVGDYLRSVNGVHGYLINAGTSNIEVQGIHPTRDNGQWLIALRNPEGEFLDPYARIYLESGQHIVTSGDYQRYFTVDDTIYHHIIDPSTLMPGREMRSITVIGPDGLFGDVLSTAAFLKPADEAIDYVESFGYEAILYDNEGTIQMSESLKLDIETE